MAQREFILQGFTARTHAAAVRELFEIRKIERVVLSVAFVNESGVDLIKKNLDAYADKVTVFAGVRNDITSWQGLASLRDMGLELYTVDTGSRNVIFHPKLYLVRNPERARLIVGSANLTLGGLNNNIEAGMLLDLDLTDSEDKAVVDSIENQLGVLPAEYPDHVTKVTAAAQLDEMLASGRLVDETAIPPPHPGTAARAGSIDTVTRIKLKVVPLRKTLTRAPAATKPTSARAAAPRGSRSAASRVAPATTGVEIDPVWESKPLTRRDLTIPTAVGTHQTGAINLDKGLLEESVDHRHYFRDEVFENLPWTPTRTRLAGEETYAKFQLVLKGVSYGEFDLRIRHSTDTTSRSYLQRNAMTSLSWGPMRPYIAHPDLIDRTLTLYRDKADSTRFVLEID